MPLVISNPLQIANLIKVCGLFHVGLQKNCMLWLYFMG